MSKRTSFFVLPAAAIVCCAMIFFISQGEIRAGAAGAAKAAPARPTASVKPRDAVSRVLKSGRNVILYFYAERIKDSLDAYKKIEKTAAKNNAVIIRVDAEKENGLTSDYGLEYVPTVFVMRPGMGIVDTFVVDFDAAGVFRNLKKDYKPPVGISGIMKGVGGGKPSLLFFMADWCGYCQHTIPEVESFKRDYGGAVNIQAIDIERDQRTGNAYLVSGVPVLVALDANGTVYRRTGYPSGYSEFEKIFKELGVKNKKKTKSSGGGA